MSIKSKRDIRIKGHGSFYLREGWLTKGLRAVINDGYIFYSKEAVDILGVGNNMVSSIKYWLNALELTESIPGENRKTKLGLTKLGNAIYNYDLHIEERFTLWLLHYKLVANQKLATSWNLMFNKFDVREFTKDDLYNFLNNEYVKLIGEGKFSVKSLNDDCTCILKTYYSNDNKLNPEETLICPLSELKILSKKKTRYGKELYVREKISMNKLHPLNVLYVINENCEKGKTTIERLLEDDNNISKVFGLDRNEVNEYLDILEKQGYIQINRTAGLNTVYVNFEGNIFEEYYSKK
ncbi:MAG: DUF4007 family protein [Clostridium sp.]